MLKLTTKGEQKIYHILEIDLIALIRKKKKTFFLLKKTTFKDTRFLCE